MHRARTALAALPLLLVGACGSAGSDTAAEGRDTTAAGRDTAAASSAETRTVDTAFGAVEVPAEPQRVVALGESVLDNALALGVTPVGALSSRGGTDVADYLAERAGDVTIVGTVRETNLEEVVRLEPDLVLASAGLAEAQYEALSALAPTVVPEPERFGDWETETRTVGAALGREEQAQELLEGIEQRAAAIAEANDGAGTAAVVRWMPTGPLVMSGSLMASRLVELTGDALPEVADFADKPHTDPLSLENLGQVDTDRLWIATLDEDGEQALQAAQASPAFRRLAAAAAGRVEVVDGGVWSSAAGPLAADRVLDDLERVVAGR